MFQCKSVIFFFAQLQFKVTSLFCKQLAQFHSTALHIVSPTVSWAEPDVAQTIPQKTVCPFVRFSFLHFSSQSQANPFFSKNKTLSGYYIVWGMLVFCFIWGSYLHWWLEFTLTLDSEIIPGSILGEHMWYLELNCVDWVQSKSHTHYTMCVILASNIACFI